MKYLYIIVLVFFILFFTSCKKPEMCEVEVIEAETDCNYNQYSTADFFQLFDTLTPQQFPVEPDIDFGDFSFHNPVFNPNNSCEIIYAKNDNSLFGIEQEIWKFNFDTGESTLIVNDYYYNLDWSVKGWIIYTGTNYQVYKIKENGDSLTQLTNQGGFNNVGKWNPSGTIFWYKNGSTNYLDNNGLLIHHNETFPFVPIDWLNDSTVIGWRDYNLYSMSIPSESLTLLNSQYIEPTLHNILYDRSKNLIYSPQWLEPDNTVNYYSYSLDGSNTLDVIKPLYGTYFYNYPYGGRYDGDVQNGKIILTLQRSDWPNLWVNEMYQWYDIVIMNTDGTDERMLLLP